MAGIAAGVKPDIEFPDIAVLRQLYRAELSSRLDSVRIIDIYCSYSEAMIVMFIPSLRNVPRPLFETSFENSPFKGVIFNPKHVCVCASSG